MINQSIMNTISLTILLFILYNVARDLRDNIATNSERIFTYDSAYHLNILNQLKKTKVYRYRGLQNSEIKYDKDRYPILYHRLLSLLNFDFVKKNIFKINLVLQIFSLMTLFIFIEWQEIINRNIYLTILSCLIFVAVTIIICTVSGKLTGSGELYFSLSERGIARIIAGSTLFFLIKNENNYLIIIGIFLIILCWKISMFARQTLVFVIVPLAIFLANKLDTAIYTIFMSAFIMIFFGKFDFIGELKSHLSYLKAYKRYTDTSNSFTVSKKHLKKFGFLISKKTRNVILSFVFLSFFLSFPLFIGFEKEAGNGILVAICWVGIISLIVSSTKLSFVGEGWRYFEYVFPVWTGYEIFKQISNVREFLIFLVVIYFWELISKTLKNQTESNTKELLNDIKNLTIPKGKKILVNPINNASLFAVRYESTSWIIPGTYAPIHYEYLSNYPRIDLRLFARILNNADFVVLLKNEFEMISEEDLIQENGNFVKIYDSKFISCFRNEIHENKF